ncbi:MarR family winged helix-turn-helix transcriptional regulator [Glaciibacter superstes]|uniref:MarR family winged helix-turn-helix transcriptional regulator n=1 Tax=Glaciibacter superstes TaxID=501023 RepID=UPI0003B36E1D|nr:MarR family transcriptional regulator [Glaciibacter superstes]
MSHDHPAGYHTGHLLRRAQQLHLALWNREVSSEVSSVQFTALSVLQRRPGISQVDLGHELDLDRSTIADLVERMIRNELIDRVQSTKDRRRKVLTLTPLGDSTVRALRPAVDRVEVLLTESLDSRASAVLCSTLLTMLAHGVEQGALQNAATATR